MGAVIRRIATMLALAAALAPIGGARAAGTTTLVPPWATGPQGGDQWNQYFRDTATGDLTVLRVNPAGISGGLGCGGTGGFSTFAASFTSSSGVDRVSVSYVDALVDPYTFVNVHVRQGSDYIKTKTVRGPLLQGGTIEVDIPATTGEVTVWFGIQVASACPNVDGGRAKFASVAFREV